MSGSTSNVAADETRNLIAASKVNGTAVYSRAGESLGSIYDVMINKRSGQVAYAVMSFGGFLGLGEDHHPLPWKALTYDTRLGGYVVDIDKDRLAESPRHGANEDPFVDGEYGAKVDTYYRTAPPS